MLTVSFGESPDGWIILHPWRNWIAHRSSEPRVAGSNPAGCTQIYWTGFFRVRCCSIIFRPVAASSIEEGSLLLYGFLPSDQLQVRRTYRSRDPRDFGFRVGGTLSILFGNLLSLTLYLEKRDLFARGLFPIWRKSRGSHQADPKG